MIEIKNLTKKIDGSKILDNVSFSVKRGEVLGFLGPNGAGKTTTMKIITSFWTPDSGTVEIDGTDVVKNSLQTRAKIGYLPENVPLYEDMKVFEFLKFVAEIRGIAKEQINSKVKTALDRCGLRDKAKKSIDELSKGYKQRVGLAQAILADPEVLILDEPTTGLDPNQIIEIRKLIKEIGREKTVIFSTHILGEVEAVCDRVIIINNGAITGEGTPEELIKKAQGEETYYVKIKGRQEEVLKKINDLAEVKRIVVKDSEGEDIIGYEISPQSGFDLREKLFKVIADNGWGVLEFSKSRASLEDVFRKLTK